MFRINPLPTFQAQVPLSVPGLPEPLCVAITFRHKNKAALNDWLRTSIGKNDAAILHELIVGWAGVQDDAGLEVPYSLSALNDLIGGYWSARDEITRCYLRELKESKTKNS